MKGETASDAGSPDSGKTRSARRFSSRTIERRDAKRLFLLKFHAMHEVNHIPWSDCAAMYEAETGEAVTEDQLRNRVKRAVMDAGFVKISEFPEKIVVSVFELSFFGCVWCAIRKFFSKIGRFSQKSAKIC